MAPDIRPQSLWNLRGFAPFRALDLPGMVRASQADFLNNREYVLGITGNGESRAYPVRFVAFHHVINDEIGTSRRGKVPVAITFCSNCNIGIRYDPRVRGKTLKLDFYGLYNGIAALCERRTQSVFLLGEGRIVTGPLTGIRLKPGVLLDTTWGAWKKLHPDTLVMSEDTPFKEYYGSWQREGQRHVGGSLQSFFYPTVTYQDKRLSPFTIVLGVTLEPTNKASGVALHRAYPLEALQQAQGIVNERLGNKPVSIWMDSQTMTATAVSRQAGSQTLTFEFRKQADGTKAVYDRETGTRWNLEGSGETCPLKGKRLERLDNHLSQWYGWSASFPDTSIYGGATTPQFGSHIEKTTNQ